MKRLGEILTDLGWISEADLEAGLESQSRDGGRLGTCLLELGLLSELRLISALSYQLGVPAALAEDLQNIPSEVYKLVPARLAVRWKAIPFRLLGDELHVAMLDTLHLGFQDELAFATGKQIRAYTGNEARIVLAMEHYFGFPASPRYRQLVERLDETPVPSNDDWQTTPEVTEEDVFGEASPLVGASTAPTLVPAPDAVDAGAPAGVPPTGPRSADSLSFLFDDEEEATEAASPAAGSDTEPQAVPASPAVAGSDTTPQAVVGSSPQVVADTSPQPIADTPPRPLPRPAHVITEPMEVKAVLEVAAAKSPAQGAAAKTIEDTVENPLDNAGKGASAAHDLVPSEQPAKAADGSEKRARPRLVIASTTPAARPLDQVSAPRPPARIASSLVEALRHYFDRVLAFRITNGKAVGWCGSGMGVDLSQLEMLSVDLREPSVLHNLAHGAACHMGPVPPMAPHRSIAAVWGAESIGECLVLPIRVQKHLLAMVLCERASSSLGSTSLALPEISSLVTVAAQELERCIIHHKMQRSDTKANSPWSQPSETTAASQRTRPLPKAEGVKNSRDTAEVPALEALPTPAWKERP